MLGCLSRWKKRKKSLPFGPGPFENCVSIPAPPSLPLCQDVEAIQGEGEPGRDNQGMLELGETGAKIIIVNSNDNKNNHGGFGLIA